MQKLYFVLFSLLFVFSAHSQVIRYTVLDVESADREKFEKAIGEKTKTYNSKEGEGKVYTFSILSGKDAWNYARIAVQNSFGEFGNSQGSYNEGQRFYIKNVSPYFSSPGSYYMKAEDEATYNPNDGTFQNNVDFRRVILYSFKDSHRDDFWRFRMRMKKTMEKLGGNRMGVLRCISGCTDNKVMVRFHFKSLEEDEKFFDNFSNVRDTYDSIYGEDSFTEDVERMWNSLDSKRIWHERRRNELSSPF